MNWRHIAKKRQSETIERIISADAICLSVLWVEWREQEENGLGVKSKTSCDVLTVRLLELVE